MKYCDTCHSTYPTAFTTCPKDNNQLSFVPELSKGMVLHGKYKILEKIGAGGMAIVYRVQHLHFQEEVAIKVVSSRLAEDPAFIDRFRTEAVITRKLRHPNAVRIDDFDTTEDGQPFIVMEYVPGESLRKLLQNHGLLPPNRAANVAKQAALALGAAHELGIVHRDIKPENILLIPQSDGSDLVKILDFGIAKVKEGTLGIGPGHEPTRTGLVLGTPKYLSPEQVKGTTSVDGRADLYALGIVLYEMLTGRVPFSADTPFTVLLQHLQSPPTPPHVLNPAISSAMSRLVLKSLDKDPAQRFQTGQEMAEALRRPEILVPAASGAPVCAPTAVATAPATARHRESGNTATGTTVLSQPDPSRPPLLRPRHLRKRTFAALTTTAAMVLLAILIWVRGGNPAARSADASDTPGGQGANAVSARSTTTTRPTHAMGAPAKHASSSAQQHEESSAQERAQAQILVATGYRRMQQHDYEAAQDAFEEALSIDPGNSAARQGLRAAKTAGTVEGVAGVLGR
jgi:serine/threonine protein kinase